MLPVTIHFRSLTSTYSTRFTQTLGAPVVSYSAALSSELNKQL